MNTEVIDKAIQEINRIHLLLSGDKTQQNLISLTNALKAAHKQTYNAYVESINQKTTVIDSTNILKEDE